VSDWAKLIRRGRISKVLSTLTSVINQGEMTMSKVSMIGTISCQAGKGDEMEAVLTAMAEPPQMASYSPIAALGFEV